MREEQLDRLHEDLRDDAYRPQPVLQKRIPKAGKPGAHRELGIPTVYDRVCQQALLNRLEPIFEPVFDDAASDTDEGGLSTTPYARSGRNWSRDASGLLTAT